MYKCEDCLHNVDPEKAKVMVGSTCLHHNENSQCKDFICADYLSDEYTECLIREYEMMEHYMEIPEDF